MSWAETLFLKKIIDGKKTFSPSDNKIILYNQDGRYSEGIIGTFKPKTNGFVRFKATLQKVYSNSPAILRLIDEDSNIVAELKLESVTLDTIYEDIKVTKNKTYRLYFPDANGYAYDVCICASIIDGSLFDYGNEVSE